MKEFLEFAFSGFWHFIGCFLFLILAVAVFNAIISLPFKLANRIMRHRSIMKNGWPPPHVDGDGDFKPEAKKSS